MCEQLKGVCLMSNLKGRFAHAMTKTKVFDFLIKDYKTAPSYF